MKRIFLLTILAVSGFCYYYFFVDTLTISEVAGKTDSTVTNILINLFDVDTDLTRYDLMKITSRSGYWESRVNYVMSLSDYKVREQANLKLLEEMLEDPAMKKIAISFRKKGMGAIGAILKCIL